MKKYFYSFSLTLLLMIASIAFLKRSDKDQYLSRSLTKRLTITEANATFKYNYLKQYGNILRCDSEFGQFFDSQAKEDYTQPAPVQTHDMRMTRAVLVYFPINQINNFKPEFKWMYRSWIEMQKHEPKLWRTDLVVFINKNVIFEKKDFFLNGLNCTFTNRRTTPQDKPMCSLVEYIPLKERILQDKATNYNYLLNDLDIYSDDKDNLAPFYNLLKSKISHYGYLDSILMTFDGYAMLKAAGYNFLIRSDMDIFLTPLFAKWLPRNCNDFYVGRGGYSSTFNEHRLGRIASDIGMKFANKTNLGSTWYSNVDQFRLVSYLTLVGMVYVSEEEFTPPEREGKLGTALWPWWHYGVLLLYGQNLALNHLIATNQINVIKLFDQLDYPSYYSNNINTMLHIHVFHGDDMFSKFQFKAGKYDNIDPYKEDTSIAKFYSLKMALEAKRSNATQLNDLFNDVSIKKV